MMHLLDKLNPPQREAATYLGGPLMIIAGAGSGKTRVITHRIAFLASEVGIPLHDILAVTFTNKAAREMRERVFRILGRDDMPSLPIGTFHSRCAMILRRDADAAGLDQNFTILDDRRESAEEKMLLPRSFSLPRVFFLRTPPCKVSNQKKNPTRCSTAFPSHSPWLDCSASCRAATRTKVCRSAVRAPTRYLSRIRFAKRQPSRWFVLLASRAALLTATGR